MHCITKFGQRSFSYKIWNEIPAITKASATLANFTHQLKSHFLSHSPTQSISVLASVCLINKITIIITIIIICHPEIEVSAKQFADDSSFRGVRSHEARQAARR